MLSAGGTWLVAGSAAVLPLLLARPSGLPRRPLLAGGSPGGPDARRAASPAVLRAAGVGVAVLGLGCGVAVAAGGPLAPLGRAVPGTVPVVVAVLAGAAAFGGWLLARGRARREAAARAARVLEACELFAAELAAGLPPGVALERAADAEALLARAAAADRLGADVTEALRDAARLPGSAGLARLAAAWHVAAGTGQALAPAVRSAAADLRRQQATDRVVAAELASARATARLLAALPLLALVLGGSGGAWSFLLGTPAGVACLAVGLAWGAAGLAWIERLADGSGTSGTGPP